MFGADKLGGSNTSVEGLMPLGWKDVECCSVSSAKVSLQSGDLPPTSPRSSSGGGPFRPITVGSS